MTSTRMLSRISITGLVLCGIALLLLTATSPVDKPLWVDVIKHVRDLTVLAWVLAGMVGFAAYFIGHKISNATKWLVFVVAICIVSIPTCWLLVAVIGYGEWLPPFGSYLWASIVNPVIAEMIIGTMIALLGALAVSQRSQP